MRPRARDDRARPPRVCAEDAYCDLLDGVTCKPRDQLGEECRSSRAFGESCAQGLRCASGTCVEAAADGEACDETRPCAFGVTCVEGVCGGPSGAGARPCYQDEQCPESEHCDDTLEQCVPRRGEGAECRDDEDCAVGLRCPTRTCEPAAPRGERCNDDGDCLPELFCDWNSSYVCADRVAVGAICEERGLDSSCARDARCEYDSSSGERRCLALGGPGATCRDARECVSGICLSGPSDGFCAASRACTLFE